MQLEIDAIKEAAAWPDASRRTPARRGGPAMRYRPGCQGFSQTGSR